MKLNSTVPLYYQIVTDIKQQIQNGILKPGYKLPAESTLCQTYQVSRVTVRNALEELCSMGLVKREPNKGHFVAKIKNRQMTNSRSMYEAIVASGRVPSSRIISMSTQPATAAQAHLFGIPLNAPVVVIYRVRFADGTPVSLEHIYLPEELFPGINPWDLEHQSLVRIMQEQFHVEIAYSNQTLTPTIPSKRQMELLNLTGKRPLVAVSSSIVNTEGRVVKYTESLQVTDVMEYTFTWNG